MEFIAIEIRESDSPVERRILEELGKVHWAVHQLREELQQMSTTAVTRDQLDAAITSLLQAEAARDAAVTQALNDLVAKVASGTVVTPEDFSAELAQITTLQTNAAALTQTATADDPGPTTVPAAPASGGATTGS
jgi:hypothetical protein